MARGQQTRTVRAALSGRNTGRPTVQVPEATEEARAAVRVRMVEFIGEYTPTATARVRRRLAEAVERNPEYAQSTLCDLAEEVSDVLGYPYRSWRASTTRTCANPDCQINGGTISNLGDPAVRGPGHTLEHPVWHPECVPAGLDMGFNRHDPDVDVEAWLLRVFAEHDAGILRPDASYEVKRAMGLDHRRSI